jgi:hypothetical protein
LEAVIVGLCFTILLNHERLMFSQAFYIPGLAMGKVYSNSMLALLNNRMTIEHGRNTWAGAWETQDLPSVGASKARAYEPPVDSIQCTTLLQPSPGVESHELQHLSGGRNLT